MLLFPVPCSPAGLGEVTPKSAQHETIYTGWSINKSVRVGRGRRERNLSPLVLSPLIIVISGVTCNNSKHCISDGNVIFLAEGVTLSKQS